MDEKLMRKSVFVERLSQIADRSSDSRKASDYYSDMYSHNLDIDEASNKNIVYHVKSKELSINEVKNSSKLKVMTVDNQYAPSMVSQAYGVKKSQPFQISISPLPPIENTTNSNKIKIQLRNLAKWINFIYGNRSPFKETVFCASNLIIWIIALVYISSIETEQVTVYGFKGKSATAHAARRSHHDTSARFGIVIDDSVSLVSDYESDLLNRNYAIFAVILLVKYLLYDSESMYMWHRTKQRSILASLPGHIGSALALLLIAVYGYTQSFHCGMYYRFAVDQVNLQERSNIMIPSMAKERRKEISDYYKEECGWQHIWICPFLLILLLVYLLGYAIHKRLPSSLTGVSLCSLLWSFQLLILCLFSRGMWAASQADSYLYTRKIDNKLKYDSFEFSIPELSALHRLAASCSHMHTDIRPDVCRGERDD